MSELKSAEEVLKFLRTITKRQEQSGAKDSRRKQDPPFRRSLTKGRQQPAPTGEQKPRRRKVDENAVLRRILDSLQPTMEQFYNNEREPYEFKEKSSATRLKIYLKQNERILKTFLREEAKHRQELQKMHEAYEEALEKEYFFTVKDAYRDEVEVLIAKNKVSKENYNSLEFMDVLVVLVEGELKIFKDKQGSRLFRNIRLFEIDNVEYNQQPFIFMVITFVKDKSKPNEYLYLKFSSPQNQQKWDRILYMNFRLKDFKRKEYLFLTDYQEEQTQVRKVQTDVKPYDVNLKKLIRYFAETGVSQGGDEQLSDDKSQGSSSARNLALLSSGRQSQQAGVTRRTSNLQEPEKLPETPKQNILTLKLSKNRPDIIPEDASDTSQVEKPDIRRTQTQQDIPEHSERILKPEPRVQQPSKLEALQQQLQSGITFEKENFFRNSMKKLTIGGDSFSYIDEKKAESAKEEDRKTVPVSSISKVVAHDDGKLEIHHGPDSKKLMMRGDVELFKQWLKLKMLE